MRNELVELARTLYERGMGFGSAGNLSVRHGDGYLTTPTNSSFRRLRAERLAVISATGEHVGGDSPTKEWRLHAAIYSSRPDVRAVVHVHSTHAVAVSCLDGLDRASTLPPLTPYFTMTIGELPLLPYRAPGDPSLVDVVSSTVKHHNAFMIANHGPFVCAPDLEMAVNGIEEIEETARLYLLLRGTPYHALSPAQVLELQRTASFSRSAS